MAKELRTPRNIKKVSFCGGCGHGIFSRLMQEVLEEKGLLDKNCCVAGVGCSANVHGNIYGDNKMECHHGRAPSSARAMKALLPELCVWTYQGDGDAYAIGMGETILAAAGDYPICVFVINNCNYGMTGGQTAPTTLTHQVTTTATKGYLGKPIDIIPQLVSMAHLAFVARGTVASAAEIRKLKGYISRAIDVQMNEHKYAFVEVLSPCPTNWHKSPVDSCQWILDTVTKDFPLGIAKG